MAEVQGNCDARFTGVRDALAEHIDAGNELGASITVVLGEDEVVDIWGGHGDEARSRPWVRDTIVNVWSTSKTVTNLAALVLVDRGLLDPYAPVARYWPEFGAAGKESIEVRQLLGHTSGVSGWEQPFSLEQMYDVESAAALLAAQAPWWEPGSASGYHALNQGHLIGELVRRITGSTLSEFVGAELSAPTGADFQYGCAAHDRGRVCPVVPPPRRRAEAGAPQPGNIMRKTLTGPLISAAAANTDSWRGATIGAANGHANARSVSRMLRAVASGGSSRGVRLLSPQTIELIFDQQSDGVDLVLGLPLRFGIGYALTKPETLAYLPAGRICFWGGWGGSIVVMDLDRGLTVSYVMNRMASGTVGSDRTEAYVRAVYAALT